MPLGWVLTGRHPHVFHPPREPIDAVMPPRGIEGMGPYLLRRGLAGESVQGTDPHRVRHGDHGAWLPPAGRPAGVQGRQDVPGCAPRRGPAAGGPSAGAGAPAESGPSVACPPWRRCPAPPPPPPPGGTRCQSVPCRSRSRSPRAPPPAGPPRKRIQQPERSDAGQGGVGRAGLRHRTTFPRGVAPWRWGVAHTPRGQAPAPLRAQDLDRLVQTGERGHLEGQQAPRVSRTSPVHACSRRGLVRRTRPVAYSAMAGRDRGDPARRPAKIVRPAPPSGRAPPPPPGCGRAPIPRARG